MKKDGNTNTGRQDMKEYAQNAIRYYGDGMYKTTDSYLWQAMLSADLSRPDKTAPRMAEEAMTLLIASGDTGARVLTVALFFIHENPKILQRLREELRRAIPDATDHVPLKELQGLPWLVSNLFTSK
jgi:cytochrome P450